MGSGVNEEPKPRQSVDDLWEELSGRPLWERAVKALNNYVELIGYEEVQHAIFASAERDGSRFDNWRYCCGICRNVLAERMGGKSPSVGRWEAQ